MIDFLSLKLNRANWIALLQQFKIQDGVFTFETYMKTLNNILVDENTDDNLKHLIEEELTVSEKTYLELMNKLAMKYCNEKNYNNATLCFNELFKYDPQNAEFIVNYAMCLEHLEQFDLQLDLLDYLKEFTPFDDSELYMQISSKFEDKNDIPQAIKYREKYLSTKEQSKLTADDYNNLGHLYNRLYSECTENMQDALTSLKYFKKASDMKPECRLFAKNATIMAGKANQYDDCGFYWERMLKINEMNNDDKFDYACFCLKKGDFSGWYQYNEARFDKENNTTQFPKINKPHWNGETDISNSTLLIYCEQGYGDTILMSGYITRLENIAKHIIYVVQNELVELMKHNFPNIEVYGRDSVSLNKLHFDYYVPAMSIPNVLKLDRSNISVGEGYLKPNENLVKLFKEKYFNNNKLKVGISFAGNNNGNKTRDIPLEEFLPLDKFDNIELYCLTKGVSNMAFRKFKAGKVHNIATMFDNFDDTAAAMENCDIIITSDNVLLNLAGALGKKTLAVFNWSYEFRWFDLTGDNTVWFTSVKPFVNEDMNDWNSSMKKVIAQLMKLI